MRLLTISSSTHQIDVRRGASISISGLSFKGSTFNTTSLLSNEGTLSLINSTVSGNTVTGPYSEGGGISNYGTLTLSNSTISGNTATSGGGIEILSVFNSQVMLLYCTVYCNTAGAGGGILNEDLTSGQVTIGEVVDCPNSRTVFVRNLEQ